MSSTSASSMPMLFSGSTGWPPSASRSNAAAPWSSRPLMCRGAGCPSLACWAAIPRRIAAQSAGG
eukprot:13312919-Alexandrium_andersonii.AAC.1